MHYASCQLSESTPWLSELPKTWKTLYFPSNIGVDSSSFQAYLKSGRFYASRQQLQLVTAVFQRHLKPGRSYTTLQLLDLKTLAVKDT